MQKRGQFYLIAGIILVIIIIGFVTISNYSKNKSSMAIYDLAEELKIESSYVLDYDVINNDTKLESFTKDFSDYAGENFEIYFIVGEGTNIEMYKYNQGLKELITIINDGVEITAVVEGEEYKFKVKSGKNFYFIIYQETGGEKYIVTN